MFSARTAWSRAENALAVRVAAYKASGRLLLDLTETNPTRAGLCAPPWVLSLLGNPEATAYDPVPFGSARAREAVAADFARRGARVRPEDIALTASTSEAYGLIIKLLCDPGDRILAPRPSYPLFDYLAGLESVHLDQYPLAYDGEWHLSLGALEERITPRTRAVVVVHPNNPTGSFLKEHETTALVDVCARRGLAILSDEVFADFSFAEDARRTGSLAERSGALTFALGGLSKSCALPQLKLGWIALGGDASLRDEARARLEIIADTYLSVSTPVQQAAPEILARKVELQDPVRTRVSGNLIHLREELAPVSTATLLCTEGGWSAVVQVPATRSEDEWVQSLLEERGVLVHPGYFFELVREGFVVLSLLPEPGTFAEAARRLARHVQESS
jgi:alanine-synthesizing transaminase